MESERLIKKNYKIIVVIKINAFIMKTNKKKQKPDGQSKRK